MLPIPWFFIRPSPCSALPEFKSINRGWNEAGEVLRARQWLVPCEQPQMPKMHKNFTWSRGRQVQMDIMCNRSSEIHFGVAKHNCSKIARSEKPLQGLSLCSWFSEAKYRLRDWQLQESPRTGIMEIKCTRSCFRHHSRCLWHLLELSKGRSCTFNKITFKDLENEIP